MQEPHANSTGLANASEIRAGFAQLIVSHPEFAQKHSVDSQLWKSVFYRVIEQFRKKIRALEDAGNKRASGDIQQCDEAFKAFIEDSHRFYHELLTALMSTYDIPQAQDIIYNDARHNLCASLNSAQKLAIEGCYRCLICLGDLARYLEQRQRSMEYAQAERYYKLAISLKPENGNAHNQLAVLATYVSNSFEALYCYYRSLAVKNPFPTSNDNIKLLFQKKKRNQNRSNASFDSLQQFRTEFVKMHEAHYNGADIEQYLESTMTAFERLVIDKKLTIVTLVQLLGTNLCADFPIAPFCIVVMEKTTDWLDEQSVRIFAVTLRLLLIWLTGDDAFVKNKKLLSSLVYRPFWELIIKSVNWISIASSELSMTYRGGPFHEDELLRGCIAINHIEEDLDWTVDVQNAMGERVLSCLKLSEKLPNYWRHVVATNAGQLALSDDRTGNRSKHRDGTEDRAPISAPVTDVSRKELAAYDKKTTEDVLSFTNSPFAEALLENPLPTSTTRDASFFNSDDEIVTAPSQLNLKFSQSDRAMVESSQSINSSRNASHPWEMFGSGKVVQTASNQNSGFNVSVGLISEPIPSQKTPTVYSPPGFSTKPQASFDFNAFVSNMTRKVGKPESSSTIMNGNPLSWLKSHLNVPESKATQDQSQQIGSFPFQLNDM